MASKGKSTPPQKPQKKSFTSNTKFDPKSALGSYIRHPERYNSDTVIYYNDNFVALHDKFPKSTVHCLLL